MDTKKKITFTYYAAFIALGLVVGMLGPSLPSFAKNTASNFSQLSTLFIFSSLGFMAGSFLSGLFLQKLEGHKVLAVVLVLLAAGIISLPVVQSLWVLVFLLFLLGICQANLDVGQNTLIMWLHGDRVAPYMNGLHFFFGLGSFFAPLLIAQSLRLTGKINASFWMMGLIILLPVIFLLRLPSPTLENSPRDAASQAGKTPLLLIIFLILFFFGFVGAENTFGNWLFTYALKVGSLTAESAAYLTSVYWGMFTFARLAGVFLSRRLSINTMLGINLSGGVISLVILIAFVDSPAALWIGSALHGLLVASTFPTAMNLAERIGAVSSRVTSTIFVFSSLGGMSMPWIAGQWIESSTPVVMMWIVLANFMIPVVMFVLIMLFQRRMKQKKPPLIETILTETIHQ